MEKTWNAGLYLRLSRDDEGSGESGSITTQRSILRQYAATQGLRVVDEYVDDGFSGTSFERPGFQRMLCDIEDGRINCVLTKDLSRLGRNSARTADLLDEYFPARGVRYIAVIDGYDSLAPSRGLALAAPLMMAVHEMYARDASGKIRASLQAKREKGDYVASFAPYGYRKDPENKNRLLPDEGAAEVVRELFRRAAEGESPGEIAKDLNGRGIATPLSYRRTGQLLGGEGRWSASGVCKLLRNEMYTGCTQQGKTRKLSFKSKAVRQVPREEWVTVPDTHEALVSAALFQRARQRCVARRQGSGGETLFRGLAFCAECGHHMVLTRGGRLCCGNYKQKGRAACSAHSTEYEELCRQTLAMLRERGIEAGTLSRALLEAHLLRIEVGEGGEMTCTWLS